MSADCREALQDDFLGERAIEPNSAFSTHLLGSIKNSEGLLNAHVAFRSLTFNLLGENSAMTMKVYIRETINGGGGVMRGFARFASLACCLTANKLYF